MGVRRSAPNLIAALEAHREQLAYRSRSRHCAPYHPFDHSASGGPEPWSARGCHGRRAIGLALCQQGPDRSGHLVREGDDHKHARLAREHLREPRTLGSAMPGGLLHHRRCPNDQQAAQRALPQSWRSARASACLLSTAAVASGPSMPRSHAPSGRSRLPVPELQGPWPSLALSQGRLSAAAPQRTRWRDGRSRHPDGSMFSRAGISLPGNNTWECQRDGSCGRSPYASPDFTLCRVQRTYATIGWQTGQPTLVNACASLM
jgi:hypothetical protein